MVTRISKTIPITKVDEYFGAEGKDSKKLVVNKGGKLGYRELSRGEKIKAFFGCGPAALRNIVKACVKNEDYNADLAFLVEKHNAKWFKKTIVYCNIAKQANENLNFNKGLKKILDAKFTKKSDIKAQKLFASKIGGVSFSKSDSLSGWDDTPLPLTPDDVIAKAKYYSQHKGEAVDKKVLDFISTTSTEVLNSEGAEGKKVYEYLQYSKELFDAYKSRSDYREFPQPPSD